MKLLVSFAVGVALVAVVTARRATIDQSFDEDWEQWKTSNGKTYATKEEDLHRRVVWENNLKQITHHNIQYSLGKETFTMGVNKFTDLTFDEFAKHHHHGKHHHHHRRHLSKKEARCVPKMMANVEVPDSVDWRTEGYVTGIKDELGCISSQYFGILGSLEGQWFRKNGQLTPLSEQNLKDCCEKDSTKCSTYLNSTCSLDATYQYLKTKGVESLEDYPDVGQPEKCAYDPAKRAATISGYDYVDTDEKVLKKAIASVGPIAAAIDSSQPSFMTYGAGVYNEPNCSSTNLDHAVLIVGYGTDPTGGDYWIVKNSWGATWGEKGYILMSRNKNNQCGIATATTYPFFSC